MAKSSGSVAEVERIHPPEEGERWKRYKAHKDERARDELIETHLPLVPYVFGKMILYTPVHLSREDLAECGVIGLIRAVQEFKLENGTRFSTFAIPRIRGAILDELRTHDWVPRSVRRKVGALHKARVRLAARGIDDPTHGELARVLRTPKKRVRKTVTQAHTISFMSLDAGRDTGAGDKDTRLVESVENKKVDSPLANLVTHEEDSGLEKAILGLPRQERMVITLHYYRDMMLKDVARLMKVSKSRVSQIHKRAIDRLRDACREEGDPLPLDLTAE